LAGKWRDQKEFKGKQERRARLRSGAGINAPDLGDVAKLFGARRDLK